MVFYLKKIKMVKVTKYEGLEQEFDREKMKKSYENIAQELSSKCPFDDFKQQMQNYLIE